MGKYTENVQGNPRRRFRIGWRRRNRKVWWAGDTWGECFENLVRYPDYKDVI